MIRFVFGVVLAPRELRCVECCPARLLLVSDLFLRTFAGGFLFGLEINDHRKRHATTS